MIEEFSIDNYKIPEPALRRLPWYLAYAKLAKAQGESHLSSTQIAKDIDVDASQVAKDLSFVNISGKTRVGYEVDLLIYVLEKFLGFTSMHKAFLFGVGNLGGALVQDNGLSQYGLKVVAAFDIKYELSGTRINQIPIHHMERFDELQKQTKTKIGILTVPMESAQKCADQLIDGGIKAIWNFTPCRIKVPNNIIVQNTSIYAHLAVMFNRLQTLND